jgi:hypothetical protein
MKWKHLRPIQSGQPDWLTGTHLSRVRKVCDAIKRRTGADAWVDARWAEVCFGYEKDGNVSLPFSCKLFKDEARRAPDYLDPVLSVWNEDSIVHLLQIARVDPRKKAEWAAAWEKMRKHDEEAEKMKDAEESVRRSWAATERAYQRHTMGRHYKGRALVSGLKGES